MNGTHRQLATPDNALDSVVTVPVQSSSDGDPEMTVRRCRQQYCSRDDADRHSVDFRHRLHRFVFTSLPSARSREEMRSGQSTRDQPKRRVDRCLEGADASWKLTRSTPVSDRVRCRR